MLARKGEVLVVAPTLVILLAQAAPAVAPAVPPGASLQQRFDAANTAAADGRCAEALPLYAALEAEPKLARNAVAMAAIAVRKGGCQTRMAQVEDGEASIRRGLPVLEKRGTEFAVDVREARLRLGDAAQARFDYAGAAEDYRAALALATGIFRIRPLMALSRVTMFDGDGAAIRHAEEALTIATGDKLARKELAVVRTQYARALMNAGRKDEAYRALKASLKEQGGLTMRVGVDDIVTRSDLAIAARLAGDQDAARQYLAYTGAGRMRDTPFANAKQIDLPPCGGETGLKPDDMAVVEFSLADDGHVIGAAPIYTVAGREAALEFARAVARWSWEAADVAKIPLLFRYTTRVELRCTRAADRPALTAPLAEELAGWLAKEGVALPDPAGRSDAVLAPVQRDLLKRAAGGPARVAALAALADNSVVPAAERTAAWTEAAALARTAGAPAPVRTYLAIRVAQQRADSGRDQRAALRALLADPAMAADPLSAATLRLLVAQPVYRAPPPPDALTLLDGVVDAPALPARHPLKVGAMLQRADLLAARGDLAGARAAFERTGLTEEQCALIEPRPAVRRAGGDANDYPMAAVQMGFEGWVRVEFDIAANGTTVVPRAIAAYPPFVFNDAAQGILRDARYTSSYRPSGNVACAANTQSVVFRLPN